MNLLVLSLMCILDQRIIRHRILRMVTAAATGCGMEAGFLLLLPYGIAVAATALVVVPLMVFMVFGRENKKQMFFRIACSWFSIVLLNGVATAVYNLTGARQLHLFAALLVLVVTFVFVQSTKTLMRQQKRMFPVVLRNGENQLRTMGLYDSGNLLTLPQQEIPVHIADASALQKLLDEKTVKEQIPFRALGNSKGTLTVYRIQEMEIWYGKSQIRKIQPVWLGAADAGLLEGKPYRIILHASIQEENAVQDRSVKRRSIEKGGKNVFTV